MRIGECNRSIERHFKDTLQASFANCGLNTEAELILANHVNVFDCIDQSIKIDTHNFSCNYCYRCYQKSIDFNRLPRSGICRSDFCLAKEIKVHFTRKTLYHTRYFQNMLKDPALFYSRLLLERPQRALGLQLFLYEGFLVLLGVP